MPGSASANAPISMAAPGSLHEFQPYAVSESNIEAMDGLFDPGIPLNIYRHE